MFSPPRSDISIAMLDVRIVSTDMERLGGLFVLARRDRGAERGARRHRATSARSLFAAIAQAGGGLARRARAAGVRAALRLLSWRRCARRRAGRFRSAAVADRARGRRRRRARQVSRGRAAREEHAEVRSAATARRRDRRVPARAHRRRIRSSRSKVDILVGDPKAGAAYFNGPGRCTTCHSVTGTGDLARIGAKYDPVDAAGPDGRAARPRRVARR